MDLIFPNTCVGCEELSAIDNNLFCFSCLGKTSYTDHFDVSHNELVFRLSGRVSVLHGAALFNFLKGGIVQNTIHQLKYRRRPDIGILLGRQFGERFLESPYFTTPDLIIPIPCHFKRQQKRGYNQSEKFAKGISEVLGIEYSEKYLRKVREIESQTQKNRIDRFENVLRSFELKNESRLENKNILLVDDVMTTGATIEAAFTLLEKIPGISVQLGLIVLADG